MPPGWCIANGVEVLNSIFLEVSNNYVVCVLLRYCKHFLARVLTGSGIRKDSRIVLMFRQIAHPFLGLSQVSRMSRVNWNINFMIFPLHRSECKIIENINNVIIIIGRQLDMIPDQFSVKSSTQPAISLSLHCRSPDSIRSTEYRAQRKIY